MSIRYVSTRGGGAPVGFEEALLAGLAPDGGLFVPEAWPRLEREQLDELQGRPYQDVALAVLRPFVEDALDAPTFRRLIDDSYQGFRHRAVAPLRQLDAGTWLMELFHGPTLAFKDVAMQLLARLFEHVLARSGQEITIVGATSGDTGAAAIQAFAGRAGVRVVILHPEGRISEVQRRQMTTVTAPNVMNIAVRGTFDDCQALLKAMFADRGFRERIGLAAINSINWARVMAQVVYYVTSALALGAPWRRVAFAVPTGNFGDVYAGYVAARMGLPLGGLLVATNVNDILARFFATGRYAVGEVHPTQSPSMDIQVASNFERLLFELCGRDGGEVRSLMTAFRETGALEVDAERLGVAREVFDAARVDEAATAATIRRVLEETGILIDPHTAVAVAAAALQPARRGVPMVVLATAHPAKFGAAVAAATGMAPGLPPALAGLLERAERLTLLPNDLPLVQRAILQFCDEAA
ncbi:MAG TPA: threonine synthase [Geminicoccaceae bacterium]